jgi:NADPH:quinone reductase-like Zn-dependent oxidoreductase
MKAMRYSQYGVPKEVLQLGEVENPTLKADEVLVKVQAASVTFGDLAAVKGEPFIVRFALGLRESKYKIAGKDVAGIVESVGVDVKQFKPVSTSHFLGSAACFALWLCRVGAAETDVRASNDRRVVAPHCCSHTPMVVVPGATPHDLIGTGFGTRWIDL